MISRRSLLTALGLTLPAVASATVANATTTRHLPHHPRRHMLAANHTLHHHHKAHRLAAGPRPARQV